jgi:hypothetical protein
MESSSGKTVTSNSDARDCRGGRACFIAKTESRSDDESTRTRAEALRSSSQPKKTDVFHVSFLDDDAPDRQTLNLGSSDYLKHLRHLA